MWGFLEDGDTMFVGLPNLATKNLAFDPATLNGHQEAMPPHKKLTIQSPMHSLKVFKSINTFAKTDLSFGLKVYNVRETYSEEVNFERKRRVRKFQSKANIRRIAFTEQN